MPTLADPLFTLAGGQRLSLFDLCDASSLIGFQTRPTRAPDHCLCLRPVQEAGLTLDALPYPYLEARPIHLDPTQAFVADGPNAANQ